MKKTALFLVVTAFVACGRDAPPPTESQATLDAGASAACREFSSVRADIKSGRLKEAAIRTAIKKVHDEAKVAPDSAVAQASGTLLRELTAGATGPRLSGEIRNLVSACGLKM